MNKWIISTVLVFSQAHLVHSDEVKAKLKSPDSELREMISWADAQVELWSKTNGGAGLPETALPYLAFFTTYDVPAELLPAAEASLSFALNSTAHPDKYTKIRKPRKISPSIFVVDIRQYGWTIEQIEEASKLEPFFADPVVDHRTLNYGRLKVGNRFFKASWFIVNALDVTKQDDRGEKNILYYLLLYGKGHEPKDAAEFQKFWKVDIDTIRVEQVETGTIVDEGDSGVSKHARQLRRGNSLYGYYAETRDVKTYDGRRDFLEDLLANNWDASEYIASHKNGLQVYLLTNGIKQGLKRVESADPGIVEDRSDPEEHRLRTAKSCISCHSTGLLPATNAVKDLIVGGGDLRTYDANLKLALESFYLQDLGSSFKRDNMIYERAVKEATGMEPADATKAFLNVYDWHRQKITTAQAAREIGMTAEEYRKQIKPNASGRLTQLYQGKSIPRDVWDSLEVGGYVQSQLLIKRIQANANTGKAKQVKVAKPKIVVVTDVNGAVMQNTQDQMIARLPFNSKHEVIRQWKDHPEWYELSYGGVKGWVHQQYLQEVGE